MNTDNGSPDGNPGSSTVAEVTSHETETSNLAPHCPEQLSCVSAGPSSAPETLESCQSPEQQARMEHDLVAGLLLAAAQ